MIFSLGAARRRDASYPKIQYAWLLGRDVCAEESRARAPDAGEVFGAVTASWLRGSKAAAERRFSLNLPGLRNFRSSAELGMNISARVGLIIRLGLSIGEVSLFEGREG